MMHRLNENIAASKKTEGILRKFLSLFIILFILHNFISCKGKTPTAHTYISEDVFFKNEIHNIRLAGTLTYPHKDGKYPAVILISGRGAQDRDETAGKHKPFLQLAEYLAQNGIAALRFNDRGVGQSGGNYDFFTTTKSDIATDVIAAFEYVSHRSEIDAKHIGLIGHSEGGVVAAMVATKISDVGFIILLASPGVNGIESLDLQIGLVAKSFGINETSIYKYQYILRRVNEILKAEQNNDIAMQRIINMYRDRSSKIEDDGRNELMRIGYYLPKDPDQFGQVISAPGWNDFFTYEPDSVFTMVRCPVLALNGDKDMQVPSKHHLNAIRLALEKGGNSDYTILELPGLNHLFQSARTGSPAEYEQIQETISPKALETIKEWISGHVRLFLIY